MKISRLLTSLSMMIHTFCFAVYSNDACVNVSFHLPGGENTILKIDQNTPICEVLLMAETLVENQSSYPYFNNSGTEEKQLEVYFSASEVTHNGSRNYEIKATKRDKEDISYIVTTLGRSSLKKIWDAESSLKKAGDRIDHLHPLRFLAHVFSDEETKVGLLQIKERGGIPSKKFFGNLYDTLSNEAELNNLKQEYIIDFANTLKIDPNKIFKPIEKRDWKELLTVLIELLPRSGDPKRYDM